MNNKDILKKLEELRYLITEKSDMFNSDIKMSLEIINFIEEKLDERDAEWKEKIEKAMPKKKLYIEKVIFIEEKSDIYVKGYNQAISDIKNNLNK